MDFFGWFLIYFLIVNIVNSEKRLFIFLLIFLIASFKLSQHGARTWAMRGFSFADWGLMGPEGPFQNSGELSVQMLMMMPIAYRLFLGMKDRFSKVKRMAFLMIPFTAMMTVLGASSRGSQIGMAVQIYHTFIKERVSFKRLLLIGCLAAGGYLLLPQEQIERFRNTGDDQPARQRILYWKNGLEMIKDHPFLGVGYYNFAPYFDRYYPDDVLYGNAQLPHNIFVQVGTDGGLLALSIYVAILVTSFRATRHARHLLFKNFGHKDHWLYHVSLGIDAAMLGFLIAGQFVTIGYYPFMWINLAFAISLANVVKKQYSLSL